eukprot:TRINITY_DN2999_c0_g2_i1.p1 TRINITY_DN2999_c0_g2~~TRINITY_DN2999_c0_g2_i1.p1  ORF type:complete len:592 (+),score=219.12 TRINITY_DN2999_c0_g2_i1:128-1903(+)
MKSEIGNVTIKAVDRVENEDGISRDIRINPRGFPVQFNRASTLKTNRASTFYVSVPDDARREEMNMTLTMYPAPISQLTDALERLLREPYGCFEQVSSTTYPMTMALQYFDSHPNERNPDLMKKASGFLESGMKKLASFEVAGGGWEWFGRAPAHESLSAYGVLQFFDIAKVMKVDEAMVKRATDWLLSRRDGNGGFKLNPKRLDSFGGAPAHVVDAYVTFSLTGAGIELENETSILYNECLTGKYTEDPYFCALISGAMYNAGKLPQAKELAEKLIKHQIMNGVDKGVVRDSDTTITSSRGKSLDIETTAVCALAWMNFYDDFAGNIRLAMDWIVKQTEGGRFGSTQATVLALKAIIRFDILSARPKVDGNVRLLINDEEIERLLFSKNDTLALSFNREKMINAMKIGERNKIRLETRTDNNAETTLPFAFNALAFTQQPPSNDDALVECGIQLLANTLEEGRTAEMTVVVRNTDEEKALGMTVAIIGLPAGVEPRFEKLQELMKSNQIAFYEIRGREVILYWREMKMGESITIRFDVTARIPGKYVAPASRCYMYYADEKKYWLPGVELEITPANLTNNNDEIKPNCIL